MSIWIEIFIAAITLLIEFLKKKHVEDDRQGLAFLQRKRVKSELSHFGRSMRFLEDNESTMTSEELQKFQAAKGLFVQAKEAAALMGVNNA